MLHLLLDSTLSLLPRGGILALRHWPLHDENFRVALQYLAHSRFNHIVVEHVCPVLYLSGRYEDIERGWKTKHRNDTRRQVKRLEQRGTCTLKLLTPEDDFDAHLHCFFRMHTRTWKERGYRSVFESPTIRGQYMVLSKEMPRNVLHFSALLLNGRPISYHFGFLFDRWFYYYKPAYDSRYKEYSPGKVHVAYLIRMGCDENWVAFDFMRGAEPYKFLWTKDTRQTVSLFITRGARNFRLRWMLNGKRRVYGRVGRYYRRAQLFLGT